MRQLLTTVPFRGVVVIGEGENDEAPTLHNDEHVGSGTGPEYDVAVDPVDGTTLLAKWMPNAHAMIAIAERGGMFNPKDVSYMDKIVVGPDAADAIDIDAPVGVGADLDTLVGDRVPAAEPTYPTGAGPGPTLQGGGGRGLGLTVRLAGRARSVGVLPGAVG